MNVGAMCMCIFLTNLYATRQHVRNTYHTVEHYHSITQLEEMCVTLCLLNKWGKIGGVVLKNAESKNEAENAKPT